MTSDGQQVHTHGQKEFSPLVRGFEVEVFEEWEPWTRLRRLLGSGHGAYGVSGPRGAGKTWLMRRAQEHADEEGGIGLWFPSPSEYDSIAFLAALTERFAEAVEEWRQERVPVLGYATMGTGFTLAVTFLFAVAGAIYLPYFAGAMPRTLNTTVIGAIAGVAIAFLCLGALRVFRAARPRGRALLYARDVKQRVRFALTRREGVDLGARLGGGLAATFGMSKQMELAERPVTLSSLVHDFRRLAGLAAKATNAPVVIAIDELDKIDDEEKVRTLLRDIKGIFGIEGVHFLVSVSHEAARSLNLNGIVDRNEFNSSFDVVLELDRVSVSALDDLLMARGWQPEPMILSGMSGSKVIAVLSGGIPREAIRLAELVTAQHGQPPPGAVAVTNGSVVAAAISPEARELRRVIVTAGPSGNGELIGQRARTETFTSLSDELLTGEGLQARGIDFAKKHWTPDWAGDSAWAVRFQEEWRRLMVRIYVASLLIDREKGPVDDLQLAIYLSTQSATVAMLTLLESLGARGEDVGFLLTAS